MKKDSVFPTAINGKSTQQNSLCPINNLSVIYKKNPLQVGEKYERKKIEKFILTEIQVNRLKSFSHN